VLRARVDLRIEARDGGSLITIAEDATNGPDRLVPPVRPAAIAVRNAETLRRPVLSAEGRRQK
jgi:hypothetical protein